MKTTTRLHIDINWDKVNIVVNDMNVIVVTDASNHDYYFAGTILQSDNQKALVGRYLTDFRKEDYRLFVGELILSND